MISMIAERSNAKVTEDVLREISEDHIQGKRKLLQNIDQEIVQLLLAIKSEGYDIALVSNIGKDEIPGWNESEHSVFFKEPIFSFEQKCAKPEQGIYEQGISLLGVDPNEIAFVGDGGSKELVGAKNVGLVPIWATWFLDHWPIERVLLAERDGGNLFPRITEPMELPVLLQEIGNVRSK